MSDDTFDILAALRERHENEKLVFPAGPAIASELEFLRARLERAEATLMRLSAHWPFTNPGRRRAKIVHIPSCAFDFIEDQLRALKSKP